MKYIHHRACYPAVALYVCGFVVLGASLQKQLSIGAVIMGWGIAEVAVMINTVAICGCLSLNTFVVIAQIPHSRCILQRLLPETTGS
jgi:hypothetical protein